MPNYQKPNYLNGLRNNYINPVLPNIMLNNPNNIFNYNQPFKFQNMQNNYNFNQLYSKPNIIQNNIEKEIKPNFSEKKTILLDGFLCTALEKITEFFWI